MKPKLINIKAIDHVVLRTADIGSMLGFYRGVLGCEIERELQEIGLTQLRAGSALIDLVPVDSELGRQGGGPPSQDGRNMDHLCLLIDRVDEHELIGYLRAAGVAVQDFQERYGADGFGRSLYINDPEGNVVELKLARELSAAD